MGREGSKVKWYKVKGDKGGRVRKKERELKQEQREEIKSL